MNLRLTCAASLGLALALLAAPNVSAQEKCKMTWENPAADSKYTQQLALDVLASEPFRSGEYSTSTLEAMRAEDAALA